MQPEIKQSGLANTELKSEEMNKKTMSKESNVSNAKTLTSLVNYQKGAVVSYTLIDKKAGTVTLFAFDQGQELSEHTAPYDALLYISEGTADVRISDNLVRLSSGEMVLMPAGKPHALSAISKSKMLLIMIRS